MPKYEKTPSGKWRERISWTDENGRHFKSFTGETQREVREMVFVFEQKLTKDLTHLRVGDAVERYINSKAPVISPTTLKAYRSLRSRFEPIEIVWLENLDNDNCQLFISRLVEDGLSPKTIRNIWGLFTAVLKMYHPSFHPSIKLPRKNQSTIKIPSRAQVDELIEGGRKVGISLPIVLAAYQGLRMSEVLGLKWSCINLEKGTAEIKEARVLGADGYISKLPKTCAGFRTVLLLPATIEEIKKADKVGEYLVGDNMTAATIKGKYNRLNKRLGMDFTFHELRHYACSVALSLNIPPKYIARMLGHEGENMVNKVYGHLMADKQDEFYNRIKEFYSV